MYIKIKEPYEQTIHIMKVHHETEDCYVCELKKDNSYLSASKEWVLAKSENLEELCDKFVYCQNGFYEMYSKLDFAHYDKEYIKNGGTIKGAIWTSKGLIYVAKMDSDGKLVLI